MPKLIDENCKLSDQQAKDKMRKTKHCPFCEEDDFAEICSNAAITLRCNVCGFRFNVVPELGIIDIVSRPQPPIQKLTIKQRLIRLLRSGGLKRRYENKAEADD